jgi:hypothetical protein
MAARRERRIALTGPAFAIIDSLSESMDVAPAVVASALIDGASRSGSALVMVDNYLKRYPVRNVSRSVSRLPWVLTPGEPKFGGQVPPGIWSYKEWTLHRQDNGQWLLTGPSLGSGRLLGFRREQAQREATEIIVGIEGKS